MRDFKFEGKFFFREHMALYRIYRALEEGEDLGKLARNMVAAISKLTNFNEATILHEPLDPKKMPPGR